MAKLITNDIYAIPNLPNVILPNLQGTTIPLPNPKSKPLEDGVGALPNHKPKPLKDGVGALPNPKSKPLGDGVGTLLSNSHKPLNYEAGILPNHKPKPLKDGAKPLPSEYDELKNQDTDYSLGISKDPLRALYSGSGLDNTVANLANYGKLFLDEENKFDFSELSNPDNLDTKIVGGTELGFDVYNKIKNVVNKSTLQGIKRIFGFGHKPRFGIKGNDLERNERELYEAKDLLNPSLDETTIYEGSDNSKGLFSYYHKESMENAQIDTTSSVVFTLPNLKVKSSNNDIVNIPFVVEDIVYTPESNLAALNILGRNLQKYHFASGEDILEFKIIWKQFTKSIIDITGLDSDPDLLIDRALKLASFSKKTNYKIPTITFELTYTPKYKYSDRNEYNENNRYNLQNYIRTYSDDLSTTIFSPNWNYVLIKAPIRILQMGFIANSSKNIIPIKFEQNLVLKRVSMNNIDGSTIYLSKPN